MGIDNIENTNLLAQIEPLKQDVETYRNFFENMPNPVYILNKHSIFLEVNNSAAKIFGYSKSFFKGKSVDEVRAPREKKNTAAIEKTLKGEVTQFEFWGISSAGDIFPQTVCMSKGRYYGEDIIYAVTVNTTALKRAEEEIRKVKVQLQESERLRSALIANMSYEIRTPLNRISGFAALLQDSAMSQEDRAKFLDIIKQSGEKMLLVVDDLINISKIESGQMTLSVQSVDLSRILGEIYNSFFPEVRSKGLDLVLSIDPLLKGVQIETDRDKLYEILNNLVRNAIDYSDTGRIDISCYPRRDGIEFEVKDKGVGIYKEKQEDLFSRLQPGHISDRLSSPGRGWGLSISRAYTELLGGTIWVESLPYKGSSFFFTIPNIQSSSSVHLDSGDIAPFSKNKVPSLKSLKILIAEDDKDSALFLSVALRSIVGVIEVVHSGTDVVRTYREDRSFDLILMDIKMPGMDGYEATREIRTFDKSVIILAQTAFGLIGDSAKSIEAGCNDHISKPIRIEMLKDKICSYFPDIQKSG